MIEETYDGVLRNKIPWAPKINYDKCSTCGKCVEFCHNRVFGFEEENDKRRTVVTNPDACVVLCRGCEEICPANAITHPSERETQRIVKKLQRTNTNEQRVRKMKR